LDGNLEYPEQVLTPGEMETGVKVQSISEGLVDSIRKAGVMVEEPQEENEEEELMDPMEVESEETYLKDSLTRSLTPMARSKTPP
jgi:hypothetical protein